MSLILTVTANVAIDKTVTVPNLQLGHRHRAQLGVVMAGGKGINVARALRRLDHPVIATGLVGGRTGDQVVDAVREEGITNDFVRIAGESRTSTVLVDPTNGVQTEINEYGPEVTPAEVEQLLAKIRYLSSSAAMVVLAGSLPRKVDTGVYAELVRELGRRRVPVAVDTDGEPLRLAVAAEPALVSPNQREAEMLVGHEFQTDEDFQDGLRAIASMGAQSVLITLKTGCYALVRTGKREQLFRAWVPRVDEVSAVGSGDALLAGYLSGLCIGKPVEECLRTAVACGAANTRIVGAGVFEPRELPELSALVEVQEIATRARAG
jgi:1-phosphofructokinase/tagatose 6-phosphate kinase